MSEYPSEWHPVFFLISALKELGADATFLKNDETLNCWGMRVNGRVVVYLIDNRHSWEAAHEDPAAAELLKRGALVMSAQKPDAERTGTRWLPLGASPGYRPPDKPVEKLFDVGFVGFVRDANRQAVLAHVARYFKLHVAQGVFGDAAVSVYWQSKVGLNVPTHWPSPTSYDSWNMRAPEILSTGTVLLTSFEDYLPELGLYTGIEGTNALWYSNIDTLIGRIEGMLSRPDRLMEQGIAGAKLARERHTYAARARTVLAWLE